MAERLTLARPYAEAVFSLAQQHDGLANWSNLLHNLSAVTSDPRMKSVISNPETRDEMLLDLLIDIVGELNERSQNFIRVLMENGRLALLPEIARLYEAMRAEAESSIDVHVAAALELNGDQEKAIAVALEKKLGKKVKLRSSVDESLIGGVKVQAGDLVIDSSVKGRLAELASQLIH